MLDWTTRAKQSSSRPQNVATHYKTSSGHQRALVPWFMKKKNLNPLNLSLDIVRHSKRKKFAIFSDSLSSLLAINNCHLETGYVQKFITDYSQLSNSGKTIILVWIPSHTGIRGNEFADEAAKSALNLSMSAVKCPATDLYSDVANHCQRLWQAEWDGCVSNKLHSVKPLLGYTNLSSLSRQDAVVLRRLRIGHTRLTSPIHIC